MRRLLKRSSKNVEKFKRFQCHMKLITVHLPETYVIELKRLVDEGWYPNASEAIRCAIRDLILKHRRAEKWDYAYG